MIAPGEPTHGVLEFLRPCNDPVAHPATRYDYRTITVEGDVLAPTSSPDSGYFPDQTVDLAHLDEPAVLAASPTGRH